MKKILTLCLAVILMLIFCACGSDDTESNIYDTYVESLIGFIESESGDTDINPNDYIYESYEKDGITYNLIYSKTQTSDKNVFYLTRTMEVEDKFITDKISEDADLSKKLTEDEPYVATTMQNHEGNVCFYVVRVMDDSYKVLTEDEKDAYSPRENIYVETGETEPILKIIQKKNDS